MIRHAILAALVALTAPSAHAQTCRASWYGPGFHGRPTASGERFNQNALTAAHRTMRFGTRLQVCRGSKCVVVRINDRGPFVRGRCIDLSRAAAKAIGLTKVGVGTVTIRRIK